MASELITPMHVDFSLTEKYEKNHGVVLLSGIQALVRALQTQAKLDRDAGLNSGGFVSGYRGSPLGGLDKALWAQAPDLSSAGIHFQPGVNEDLAATAVWGSQQVGLHEGATVDGVFGMWYGKTPGLDRSCDAIRHANAWGTSSKGGVLMVVGDDPAAKSSSLATQSEFALQDMMVPILAPSNIQDVLDFSIFGWALSRYSGLWVALKAVADHMDSSATVDVGTARYENYKEIDALGEPAQHSDAFIRRDDTPIEQEQRMLETKLPLAISFARRHGINQWVTQDEGVKGKKRLGIVAAGKAYQDVREACARVGLMSLSDIHGAGIELLKLGMTWPLDPQLVQQFSKAVDKIWVVEEKRAFVEPQVKEILYGQVPNVPVLGKAGASGEVLLPSTGILDVSSIAEFLVSHLGLEASSWLKNLAQSRVRTHKIDAPAKTERTPLFCAGCPHNSSTRVPRGSRATAGIGCHYMVQWMDRKTDSCTQMGGEGVTWVGEAPFTRQEHIFANLGDGTYFHSGILAIRQAVAAGVNITYKILFNDAVAMTGGQPTDGELRVSDVVAQVGAEGVTKIVVVSDDTSRHQALVRAGTAVFHRSELDNVQRDLRQHAGVSVLVYQQTCATELRRQRKRGLVEDVRPRLVINEAVCDGCGDCSVQSNCVAVEPVETTHGVKRKINQTSCNKDLSCATGYCPAFVEVTGALKLAESAAYDVQALAAIVAVPKFSRQSSNILITGVGGTGIVTVSALLAAAAKIDGKNVSTLDMTGLAQKGGAVFAHVRIGSEEVHSARIPDGCVDVLIGCDLVSAASNESLQLLNEDTSAIVNSHVMPTAEFVLNQSHDTKLHLRMSRIKSLVGEIASLAAEDSVERLLGDAQQANVMLLGYAYQLGGIPLSLHALEAAIKVNAVAVERNLTAFHLGRIAAVDSTLLPNPATSSNMPPLRESLPASLRALVEQRMQHLTRYQNSSLAHRYKSLVDTVSATEQSVRPGSEQLAYAAAQSYAKLLAVKDEFEVARLHLLPEFAQALQKQFAAGASLTYLLAPPLLARKSRPSQKRRFGSWMRVMFLLLAPMKRIRNSIFDPFAYSQERKTALSQIEDFEALVTSVLTHLNCQNLSTAIALISLPQTVRGFGHVKLAQLAKAQKRQAELLVEFHRPPQPVQIVDPASLAAA